MTPKLVFMIGSALAGLSVATGAFGAHGLANKLEPRMLEVWETASRYNMYHALALLAVAWLLQQTDGAPAKVAAIAIMVGVALFSGSLYVMALSGIKWLGAVTPLGGVAFLIGWVACIVAAARL